MIEIGPNLGEALKSLATVVIVLGVLWVVFRKR